jgi:glycosyltransferase involved in cell wall biosynthesis
MPRLTVSLCIPTHARPLFLLAALESGLAQTRRPDEILVSDDLGSNSIRDMVAALARQTSVPIRYTHCSTGQGLADNINHCLREAMGDLVLLLHDDDLLMDRSIEVLAQPFEDNDEVVATFGRQLFVTHTGEILQESSENSNRDYRRTSAYAGVQVDAVLSGIWQQFPNDGYMVRTEVARRIKHGREFQSASEVDFGIRLGALGLFYFVDEDTTKYRLSENSLNRGENSGHGASAYHAMRIYLHLLNTRPLYSAEIVARLKDVAPRAVCDATKRGEIKDAFDWYFGPYHRHLIMTLGGIRRGLQLLVSGMDEGFVGNPVGEIEGKAGQKAY